MTSKITRKSTAKIAES